jgi:hypothetical protein
LVRHGVARLNLDGSVDPVFDPGAGPQGSHTYARGVSGTVFSAAVADDGSILVAGAFPTFDGFVCDNLVRLFGGDQVRPLPPHILASTAGIQSDGAFHLTIDAARSQTVVVEESPSMAPGTWVPVSTNTAPGGLISIADPALGKGPRFYRAFSR